MSLGDDAYVYVWDIGARRCIQRWKDDGGFGTLNLAGSPAGDYVAVGSVQLIQLVVLRLTLLS